MCDNNKCVKGTDKCEAEIWKKKKTKQRKGANKWNVVNTTKTNVV